MMIRFIFNSFDEISDNNWISVFFLGISFLFIGLLILLVPEILIVFITSIFFLIGGFFIYISWKIKEALNKTHHIKININE